MSMNETRAAARDRQREIAEELKASGALDGIFAQIDAGAALTGSDGLLSGMLKAVLERGLEVEMSDHLGYDRATRTRRHILTRVTARARRRCPPRLVT